jgi:hypothetical protein
MRMAGYGAALVAAVAAGACGSTGDVTEPLARPAPSEALAAKSDDGDRDAKQKVTGNALFQIDYAGNPYQRYSVAAIRHRDGSFSGQVEEQSEQDGGQRMHGAIHCFRVAGDTARLAARVTHSNFSFGPPGSYVIWNVVDGGRSRHGDGADRTTDFYFGGTRAQAEAHCRANLLRGQPYYPVIRGDLRVDD